MADVYTVVTCPYTRPSLIWLSSIEVQHSSDLCILHIIHKRVRSTVTSTQHKFNICMIACERVTKPFMFLFLSGFFVFFCRVHTGPRKLRESWNFIVAFSRTGKSWKKAADLGKFWKSVKLK